MNFDFHKNVFENPTTKNRSNFEKAIKIELTIIKKINKLFVNEIQLFVFVF